MTKSRIFVIALAVLALWLLLGSGIQCISSSTNFSDALEASGALFAAFAFSAAGYALHLQWQSIMMQREELALQRQELADTRVELRGQKEQLEIQNSLYSKQHFEISFFNILNLHCQYVGTLGVEPSTGSAFYGTCHSLNSTNGWANEVVRRRSGEHGRSFVDIYNSNVEQFEGSRLARSITLWRSMFLYIDENCGLAKENKAFYYNLVMAQFDVYECALLAHHLAGKNGLRKMRDAIEEYGLFAGFRFGGLLNDDVKACFNAGAFTLGGASNAHPTASASTPNT